MSNQGYGICGAKNIYCSKVNLDNWVEDEIGAVIANVDKPKVNYYQTVQMASHCLFLHIYMIFYCYHHHH